ncbi:MAG: sodium-translocating pyrophosphatase [Candidatus Paraimprobicoccus trichonymphae]|uniref:Putative K(+)-stimulated pyrophosphate-energized sodium pump n=1 Tax=Candidatus Paraimprobicoccus trichonymphae TaxID=3033793 RepID=A0AA48HZX5_9FIRM|nr:MAG: sodium-translocating pyrophosphatase [Candidatus Paraimprobicoccus trichonymphae]
MGILAFIILIAIVSLCFAAYKFYTVKSCSQGTEKMIKISDAIRVGANAYLKRQYKGVAIFFGFVFLALLLMSRFDYVGKFTPFAFLTGGFLTALSGYIGMKTATMANSRTAFAATSSLNKALKVAFSSGSVMSFMVVGIGLLDVTIWYCFLKHYYTSIEPIRVESIMFQQITSNMITFGIGVSCMSLFARVGGGIFTKAADVGADLVGKVEKNIPEDDPRNPAVIADNVGDNVGDIAGMGADLYESYVSSLLSSCALGVAAGYKFNGIAIPLILAACGIVVSLAGTFFVKTTENANQKSLLKSIRMGTYVSAIMMAFVSFFVIKSMLPNEKGIFYAIICGLLAGVAIGFMTEYYTSDNYGPVKNLAKSSEIGAATMVINGLSLGMKSTVAPVIIISASVLISFFCCGGNVINMSSFNKGLYGIAIAAVGMLSTLGITLATDAYGPIVDNAGGIAEMSELGEDVRKRTDALDSLGNTTAATGKGFAIGSAALTALALIASYISEINKIAPSLRLNLSVNNPPILIGMFLGAMLPFIFSALTMEAVGKAAQSIVLEVRKQFKEIVGLFEGKAEPDYVSCVDLCTKASQNLMIAPILISVSLPVLTGLILGPGGVTGLLAGTTVTGFALSIMMSNAGGAWDNAKKFIEAGNYGGKNSECHKAAVVCDTIGDPFKDTSGPSINILLKLTSIVSIVFAAVTIAFHLI